MANSPWNDPKSYIAEPFVPNHALWRRRRPNLTLGTVLWLFVLIGGCVLVWAVSGAIQRAYAHMADHPDLDGWFAGQQNSAGWSCCDGSEVIQLTDSEWKMTGDHYEVFHEGKWWPITQQQVSPGGNRLPSALVWWYAGEPRCFKPATFY